MPHSRAYRLSLILLLCASLHLLLLGLIYFTTIVQGTAIEAFGLTAVIVPYLLQHIGLPVLENNGLSGWGWPSPNLVGWLLSVVVWFAFYWLVAIVIERLTRHSGGRGNNAAPLR